MTRLSLCVVGQDQQDSLPEFFEHVSGMADEVCFVDYGSRDQSSEVAKKAGARTKRVEAGVPPWQANNACLELATGDWILWLQANERPTDEFKQAVATAKDDPNLSVGCTALRHLLPEGQALTTHENRLFRRDPELSFDASRPDDLSAPLLAAIKRHSWQIFAVQGQIDCCDLTEGFAALDDGRDLLRQRWQGAVDQDPKNLHAWTRLLEQARLWDDSELLAEAAPKALEVLQQMKPERLREHPDAGECLTLIAAGLFPEAHKPALLFLYPDAPQEALDFLLPWAEKIAPSAAFFLRLGELHELCGNDHLEDAAAAFDAAIGQRPTTLKIHLATVRPLLGLARVALGLQQPEDALRFLNLALGEAPRDPEALLALTSLSQTLGGQEAARDVVAAYTQTYGDAPELHGAMGETALRAGDTTTAVRELQLAVGDQASASPYSSLLDEALLAAL